MIEHTGFVGFNNMLVLQEVLVRPSQNQNFYKNYLSCTELCNKEDFLCIFLRLMGKTLPGKRVTKLGDMHLTLGSDYTRFLSFDIIKIQIGQS